MKLQHTLPVIMILFVLLKSQDEITVQHFLREDETLMKVLKIELEKEGQKEEMNFVYFSLFRAVDFIDQTKVLDFINTIENLAPKESATNSNIESEDIDKLRHLAELNKIEKSKMLIIPEKPIPQPKQNAEQQDEISEGLEILGEVMSQWNLAFFALDDCYAIPIGALQNLLDIYSKTKSFCTYDEVLNDTKALLNDRKNYYMKKTRHLITRKKDKTDLKYVKYIEMHFDFCQKLLSFYVYAWFYSNNHIQLTKSSRGYMLNMIRHLVYPCEVENIEAQMYVMTFNAFEDGRNNTFILFQAKKKIQCDK